MLQFIKDRINAFSYAFQGFGYVMRTQRNAWVHAFATICAISFGLWLRISRIEWAILTLTVAIVWAAEFINTALEAIVDLASPDIHPLAKVGKDVAAAAVLIAALASILIGFILFGQPLWEKIAPLL